MLTKIKVVSGMKLPKLTWPIVFLTFAVCLLVLFSGYWLWQRSAISGPLQGQLAKVPGVASVVMQNNRAGMRIELVASQNADFVQTAESVRNLVSQSTSGKAEIVWKDDRSPNLAAARESINFILREAQVRHEYVAMAERTGQVLQARNIAYQLGVGEHCIYLKLQDGDKVWLEVLPVIGLGGEGQ